MSLDHGGYLGFLVENLPTRAMLIVRPVVPREILDDSGYMMRRCFLAVSKVLQLGEVPTLRKAHGQLSEDFRSLTFRQSPNQQIRREIHHKKMY